MKPSEVKPGMRVVMIRPADGGPYSSATVAFLGVVEWLRYGGCSVRFDNGEVAFFNDANDPWARFTEVVASVR